MKENMDLSISWILSAVSALITTVQENPTMQWVMTAFAILSSIVSLAYTIYKWWKKAKADGKVSADEVGDLLHDLDTTLNKEKKDEKDETE